MFWSHVMSLSILPYIIVMSFPTELVKVQFEKKSPLTRAKTRLSVGWTKPRWLAITHRAWTPAVFLKKLLPFQKNVKPKQ